MQVKLINTERRREIPALQRVFTTLRETYKLRPQAISLLENSGLTLDDMQELTDEDLRELHLLSVDVKKFNQYKNDVLRTNETDAGQPLLPTYDEGIVITVRIHNWKYSSGKFPGLKKPSSLTTGQVESLFQQFPRQDEEFHLNGPNCENLTAEELNTLFGDIKNRIESMSDEDHYNTSLVVYYSGHGGVIPNNEGTVMIDVDGLGFDPYAKLAEVDIPKLLLMDCCREEFRPQEIKLVETRGIRRGFQCMISPVKRGVKTEDGFIATLFTRYISNGIDDAMRVSGHQVGVIGTIKPVIEENRSQQGDVNWLLAGKKFELYLNGVTVLKDDQGVPLSRPQRGKGSNATRNLNGQSTQLNGAELGQQLGAGAPGKSKGGCCVII